MMMNSEKDTNKAQFLSLPHQMHCDMKAQDEIQQVIKWRERLMECGGRREEGEEKEGNVAEM